MNITFEKYIEDVKSQLTCNTSDEQMLNNLTYFIMFSGDYRDSYDGTIIAKKYHGIPSKQKEELCNIFGFRILSEEEFENIKAYKKIIL